MATAAIAAALNPPVPPPPTTAPATQPFQPGVAIDWRAHAVHATGRVVLREGPLEFFACGPGKEHESVVLLEASAEHLYAALGLAGFSPGAPPRWDPAAQRFRAPKGDLVSIRVRYGGSGHRQEVDAFTWVREIEYARPARSVPWVFAGSQRMDSGRLAAGTSGALVALVDFPDSLLGLSRRHSNRNAALWAEARTDAIPPLDTPVTLIFRRPGPTPHTVWMDARGDLIVDGRVEPVAGVIDLIRLARRTELQRVQTIAVRGALRSDVRRLAGVLRENLPPGAVRLVHEPVTTGP